MALLSLVSGLTEGPEGSLSQPQGPGEIRIILAETSCFPLPFEDDFRFGDGLPSNETWHCPYS